jgi:hypothetical protein
MLADAVATFGDGGAAPPGESPPPEAPVQSAGGSVDLIPIAAVVGMVAVLGLLVGALLVLRRQPRIQA